MIELKTGVCGNSTRFMLGIINAIMLFAGFTIFIMSMTIFWSTEIVDFIKISDERILFAFATLFLIIGCAIIVFSAIGLCGVCCMNKWLLIVYEVIIIALFLAHCASIILFFTEKAPLRDRLTLKLEHTVNTLKNESSPVYNETCAMFKIMSAVFRCCGYNSSADFASNHTIDVCCSDVGFAYRFNNYQGVMVNQRGCRTQLDDFFEHSYKKLVGPSIYVLVMEFIAIVMIPLLLGIIRYNEKHDDNERNNVQYAFRTYDEYYDKY